jgi:hypothetical protein
LIFLSVFLISGAIFQVPSAVTQGLDRATDKGPVVDARAFGVKCDGVTNDTKALLSAVQYAGGRGIVELPAGTSVLDGDVIRLTVPKIHIRGAVTGFIYGASASGTTLRFTQGKVGISSFATDRDTYNIPYITLENITIDGGDVLTTGFEGGFFSRLVNCSFINCRGQGVLIRNGQTSSMWKCGFNGNGDGLLIESGGTQYVTECVFRENKRHGVVIGGGGTTRFESCIFESNAGSGVNLSGTLNHIQFLESYFEQNDISKGPSGYQVRIDVTGPSEDIVFENTVFGSTGLTKVAHIQNGRVQFRNCSQAGDPTASPVTRGAGAEVVVDRSFPQYPLSTGIKMVPEVFADPSTALEFSGTGRLDIGPAGITFGSNDFTVGFTVEPREGNFPTRPVMTGDIGGFTLGMTGSAAGMGGVYLARTGQAAFHVTKATLRNNSPNHVAYARISGNGYLYLNGVLVDSFPDRNNYSAAQKFVGAGWDTVSGLNAKLFSFTIFRTGLNALQVFELWRNGGNAGAAGLGGLSLNLRFDNRPPTQVLDSVTSTWFTTSGTVAWVNPQQGATYFDPKVRELRFWDGTSWKPLIGR